MKPPTLALAAVAAACVLVALPLCSAGKTHITGDIPTSTTWHVATHKFCIPKKGSTAQFAFHYHTANPAAPFNNLNFLMEDSKFNTLFTDEDTPKFGCEKTINAVPQGGPGYDLANIIFGGQRVFWQSLKDNECWHVQVLNCADGAVAKDAPISYDYYVTVTEPQQVFSVAPPAAAEPVPANTFLRGGAGLDVTPITTVDASVASLSDAAAAKWVPCQDFKGHLTIKSVTPHAPVSGEFMLVDLVGAFDKELKTGSLQLRLIDNVKGVKMDDAENLDLCLAGDKGHNICNLPVGTETAISVSTFWSPAFPKSDYILQVQAFDQDHDATICGELHFTY